MDVTKAPVISDPPSTQKYPVPYLLAFFTLLVSILIYVGIERGADFSNIQNNWPEYRCQPLMMPFAGMFGHDVNENFQFCLQQIIQEQTRGVTGPFVGGMFGFTTILSNLMNSVNSFRVTMATLVGGVLKIISEFKTRMTALMGRVKLSASRMKAMMYRVYGTMMAVMFMGISAQTGISNFGDTFIFKFIDTFCFPPEQLIELENKQKVPIQTIEIGTKIKGGHCVESIYKFYADGQPMVRIGNVIVSSNHFVKYQRKWILSKDHPDAISVGDWSGGTQRPLICLSTDTHRIQIDDYTFADYDETDEGNAITQAWVDQSLNGETRKDTPYPGLSYEVGSPSETLVKTLEGYKALSEITLGTYITKKGRVVGIQKSMTNELCNLPCGRKVARGSLLWSALKGKWVRAYSMYPSDLLSSMTETIALFVSPGAQYELEGGQIVRDAMEIYSPDTKQEYARILTSKIVVS